MLFYGHFSFSYKVHDGKTPEPWHGFLTTLVEAKDVNEAVSKCRALIRRLHKRDILSDAKEVYLETLMEVHSIPAGGVVPYMELNEGENVGGIRAFAPLAPAGSLQNYGYGEKPPTGEEETEYRAEPFVILEPQTDSPKRAMHRRASRKRGEA